MHIWFKSWRDNGFEVVPGLGAAAIILAVLGGCASPGPPLPPTLNLPQVVSGSGLTATRVGDQVSLHWTTPTQTTDKLAIQGAITAEICREVVSASVLKKTPCSPVGRLAVTPGASDAADALPAALTAEPPRLLAYRVQLLNAVGRTAGPSLPVYAAAGPAPRAVEGFSGEVTRDGVALRWRAESQGTGSREQGTGNVGTVELERTLLDAAPVAKNTGALAELTAAKQPAETRFRAGSGNAGATDPGGTIDRTVEIGHRYRYTAQRVTSVAVGGQTLEARSVPSAALEFAVRDVFAPDVPKGLVAIPGMAGGVGAEAAVPTIDLSWEPDVEARVAGYRVYRREAGSQWLRVGPELVTAAAFRDLKVTAGRTYSYRVTAVSTAGNESAASGEVTETAASQ